MSTTEGKLSSRKDTLDFEIASRGDYNNLAYTPVFKASAIFFIILQSNINTKISFLNYWKIKNHNENVSCLYTLRDEKGKKIYRNFFFLKNSTYTLCIKSILESLEFNKEFIGTIEVEFNSNQDLKFAYPALDVFYETYEGVSVVHTNQRVFNDIEDSAKNISINQTQSGFDIYCDEESSSFLGLLNGPLKLVNKKLSIAFFNHKGEVLEKQIIYEKILPYEVLYINFDRFPELKNFLNNKTGFCKVNSPMENIFNRIVAGTMSKNKKRMSVTHSYYDCSDVSDYIDTKLINKDHYNCFFPLNMIDDILLDVVFYPIFSKSNLNVTIEKIDRDGNMTTLPNSKITLGENFKSLKMVEINKHLPSEANQSDNVYFINVTSDDNLIPSRLPFGVNYRKKGWGSNVNLNIYNYARDLKKRSYLWGPALTGEKFETIIALTNFNKKISHKEENNIQLTLYNESGKILEKKYKTHNPQSLNINVKNLIKENNIKTKVNEIIWFTIESVATSFVCMHIHKSIHGLVAADHSF